MTQPRLGAALTGPRLLPHPRLPEAAAVVEVLDTKEQQEADPRSGR